LIHQQKQLQIETGILVANPIPSENELAFEQVEATIVESLKEAEKRGIRGKGVTPFLLSDLVSRTQGKTLKANIALIKNNARVAAMLSVELSKLGRLKR
jgi:pseudouridine-5'-phosphate glycosidase